MIGKGHVDCLEWKFRKLVREDGIKREGKKRDREGKEIEGRNGLGNNWLRELQPLRIAGFFIFVSYCFSVYQL